MIPVKICGITNLEDARVAVSCGASALGFIFYDKSPRYISPETAGLIAADLKGHVSFVGVFIDETLEHVHSIADIVGLNFIQLHGNESSQYCHKVQFPVIKVFKVAPQFDVGIINNYNVHAFLFDNYEKGRQGGTGKAFNWDVIIDLPLDKPIILSGGLSIDNIKRGINSVCPSAVDVNSGVELNPGVKDGKKMKVLFNIIKKTDNTNDPFEIPVAQESSHEL